jgi:hypothetical protein
MKKKLTQIVLKTAVFIVSEIQKMGLKFWDGFRYYIDSKKPDGFDWSIAFDLVSRS